MSPRLLRWAAGVLAGSAGVGLALFVAQAGLEAADRLASVIGAFVGLAALGLAAFGLEAYRVRMDRRTSRPTHTPDVDEDPSLSTDQPGHPRGDLQAVEPAESRRPMHHDRPGHRPEADAVPHQLPTAIHDFAGRVRELETLTTMLERSNAGGTVVISAIDGTAGIGKTTIAVSWAHRVAHLFPDGQLYVNLRGFDPSGPPMMPSEAIHGFLEAFDVPTERIPVTLHGQAAMYRTLLAGKRVLVVLDNARDTDQVRPLLPGSAGCFVVATSRNRLTSLLTTEGAYPVTLDLLSVAEATELLEQRIGRHRVTAEPEAAAEIISMCARLPLALAIVAARAATHPTFSLAALASELRQVDGTLAGLAGGEVSTDLRAVFSWSYERLGDRAGRLFCLMGLHPGPDLSLPAAVSLAGSSGSHTRAALTELAFAHMIDEVVPGRFTFHDLLRAYAGEQARTSVADGDRSAAMQRLLSHYLYSGNAAALRQIPRTAPLVLPELPAGVSPESPADFDAAQAWFDAEHAIMLGAVRLAAHSGFNVHAWQLAWILIDYLDRRGSWQEWMMAQQIALEVVKANDDRLGEAFTHRGLGLACLRLGHYVEAEEHFHQSRRIFGELGDVIGYADSNIDLGWMLGQQGRPKEALDLAVDVLETSMSTDHRLLQARAANNIGWFYALAGEPVQTLSFCEQALELYREIGDPRSEAYALVFLGYAHLCLGHHAQAVTYLERSLTLERAASDRYRHAMALSHLGAALRASGRVSEARNSWTEALQLLSRLGVAPGAAVGYPDPGRIRADLDAVDSMKDEPIPLADESPSRG